MHNKQVTGLSGFNIMCKQTEQCKAAAEAQA